MPSPQFQELENTVRSIYLLADPGIVKLLCACTIAHRYPIDAIWVFIIAGSSCGKTELIAALNEVAGYVPMSMMTQNTFISGQQRTGTETSMLMNLHKHQGILTFKDFTTLISMNREALAEIMAQLREIYDGQLKKIYGTGKVIDWKGKVSIIAGCTSAIYSNIALHSAMGERFLMYSLQSPDAMEVLDRMDANATDMKEKRQILKDAFKKYLDTELGELPETLPQVDDQTNMDLKQLAIFTTKARSPIERDMHSPGKEIIFKHDTEGPTRFYSQIKAIAGALMVINGNGLLETLDRDILFKVSLDSIPKMRHTVLQELARYSSVETNGLAIKLNYPNSTVSRALEDLNALELVDRRKGASNRNLWTLHNNFRQLLQRFEGITDSGTELVSNAEGDSAEATKYASTEKELDVQELSTAMFGDHT